MRAPASSSWVVLSAVAFNTVYGRKGRLIADSSCPLLFQMQCSTDFSWRCIASCRTNS